MDMEQIVSIISSVGFPIVCCYFMWVYINGALKEFNTTMKENTEMLIRICEKLDISNRLERGDDYDSD